MSEHRILLLGSGGSGKSTLARELGKLLDIVPTHLDALYWRPGWRKPDSQEWVNTLRELVCRSQWIIDGYYADALEQLVPAATLIIYLDTPRVLCLLRVLRRESCAMLAMWCRLSYNDDAMPVGCPPALRWQFLRWIWHFPFREKPRVFELVGTMRQEERLSIVRTPSDLHLVIQRVASPLVAPSLLLKR